MKKMSIIIPCYNEEDNIKSIYKSIIDEKKELSKIEKLEYEMIFVDDGSNDKTVSIIKSLLNKDNIIKFISFTRNFGKEAAMYAGLCNASGDYIVVMDADGQDPVKYLSIMLKYIKKDNYECVACRRNGRDGEPLIRSYFSNLFYKLINVISTVKINSGARDYRMFTRKYLNALLKLGEYNRFSKGLFSWIGFETKWIDYENVKRENGNSKWSFIKLLKYSVEGILAFSTAPLVLISIIGFIICFISMIFLVYILINKIFLDNSIEGWTSLACLIVFIGGLTIFSVGILCLYVAKIYSEIKGRPIYIINDTNIGEK